MKTDIPEEFLGRNGIKFTRKGGEFVLDCHECGKSGHLYLNAKTWLWNCKRCDARGNERTLKRGLGLQYDIAGAGGEDPDKAADAALAAALMSKTPITDVERWTVALVSDPRAKAARDYLSGRGIPVEVAERYRLGWSEDSRGGTGTPQRRRRRGPSTDPAPTPAPRDPGTGWIVIPSFTRHQPDGRPDPAFAAVVKLRSVPPAEKAFARLVGGESVLYSPTEIDPTKTVLLVGGELDALSCVIAGFPNVVSSTTGETGLNDAMTAQLESCEDIVVIYDNDEVGRKESAKAAERLGAHRCRIGAWPDEVKDANEALQKLGESFDVRGIVDAAKPAGGDQVVRVDALRAKYVERLRNGNPRGISTGWDDMDDVLGGVRWGEVTLVTGDTASGKSTWCSQWALQMAAAGIKTLVCPFELGAQRQLDKWVRQWSRHPPDTLSDRQLDDTLDALEGAPLWVLDRYGSIKVEAMRNTMMYAIRRLGIKFILVDHIHFMVDEGPNEREELGRMMKMLAELAVDLGVHVVIVAHPRQQASSNEKHRDNKIIQMSDLKGNSSLKQLSDNIISIWRPRKADRAGVIAQPGMGVAAAYVLKMRSDYGTESSVAFAYEIEASRYEPPAADMIAAFREAMGLEGESAIPDNAPAGAPSSPDATRPRRQPAPSPYTAGGGFPGDPAGPSKPSPRHWTEEKDDEIDGWK